MPAADGPGFVDRSLIRKTEVRGPASELGTAVQVGDGSWWCPVAPTRTLVLGANADGVDVTCAYAAIELVGARTNDLIATLCAIDMRHTAMPVGAFRPGSVARTPGFVLRTGPESLLLLVGWALGAYLWTVVSDAAKQLYA
jgi:sarcosine oxidase gamma subunit